MRYLRPGMHARIGTACALDFDIAAEEVLSGFANLALNGSCVRLFLPAAILGAVVLENQSPGFQFPSLAAQPLRDAMMTAQEKKRC